MGIQNSLEVNFPGMSTFPRSENIRENNFSVKSTFLAVRTVLNRFKPKQCNRFKLAQNGSNRLKPVQTGSDSNQFKQILIKKWFKLVQTGSNWSSVTGSNRFRFKPVQTGSNQLKSIQTGSNQFKSVQTSSNRFRLKPVPVQTGSNPFKPFQTSSNWFRFKNGSNWFKQVQTEVA